MNNDFPLADSDDEPLVLYYQVTLGPAHLARIRALDAQPGLRCLGVQLASRERTRGFSLSEQEEREVVTVVPGVYEAISRSRLLREAARQLGSSGASAIIVDSPADPVQLLLGRWAKRRGVLALTRWAATVLDHPRKGWKERLKGFVYRGWDGYLATGERGIEYLRSFGVPESLIFACGNPVDHASLERVLATLPACERNDGFLFVGRFLRLKNLERFAGAYRLYRERGGSWPLHLVGFGESETAVRRILDGQAGVVFYGHLQFDALIPLYRRAACVVLPSYSENWGLVVNEAMHAGSPILLSRAAGCYPELLEEGGNGFGLDWQDENAMADALLDFERLDPAARQRMSRRSQEIIADHTVEAWAERVARAIHTVRSAARNR